MDPRTVHLLALVGLGLFGLAVGRLVNGGIARLARCPLSPRLARLGEVLTGVLYLACLWRFGWQYALVPGLVLVSLLVPLALIDAEHWKLPLELTLPGIAAGVLLAIPLGAQRVEGALWGATVGFLGIRALEYLGWRAFGREALGGGDKYLLALLGAFLTPRPLLAVFVLAALQAAFFGVVQWLRSRRPGEDEPPPEAEQPPAPTLTWRFLAPGLSLWRRVMLIPFSLLIQPIPDRPPPVEELEATPGVWSFPFGPWLVLAGLEVLFLGA